MNFTARLNGAEFEAWDSGKANQMIASTCLVNVTNDMSRTCSAHSHTPGNRCQGALPSVSMDHEY